VRRPQHIHCHLLRPNRHQKYDATAVIGESALIMVWPKLWPKLGDSAPFCAVMCYGSVIATSSYTVTCSHLPFCATLRVFVRDEEVTESRRARSNHGRLSVDRSIQTWAQPSLSLRRAPYLFRLPDHETGRHSFHRPFHRVSGS